MPSLQSSLPPALTLPHPPLFFFFNDTATTDIYTLSLHDALPISSLPKKAWAKVWPLILIPGITAAAKGLPRSEEHTSELQSRFDLVCRLLLEKKKNITIFIISVLRYEERSHVATCCER